MKYRALAALAAFVVLTGLFYAAFSTGEDGGEDKLPQQPIAANTSRQTGQQAALQPAAIPSLAKASVARLQALAKCEQQPQNCALDNSDSRSAYFDLGGRQAAELSNLTKLAQAGALDGVDAGGIARRYMAEDNGHVQEAALSLISALPPNPANVDVILDALQRSHDAGIYTQAMHELLRYPDQGTRNRVENTLIETLQTGGHFAGQSVAQEILPFLNNDNLARFRDLAEQLPPGSAKRRLLEGTLSEFQQRQRGG